MILVGSKALSNYRDRSYFDIDLIANLKEVEYFKKILTPSKIVDRGHLITFFDIEKNDNFDRSMVEFLITDSSKALTLLYNIYDNHFCKTVIGSKEILYSLKKAHIYYPIKFNKHIEDYCFLHKELNGIDKLKKITKINKEETKDRLGKLKTPSLNKSKEEFFGQSEGFVKYYFIHDDIHRMVAHYDNPLYEKMQPDTDSVWCSKDLWNKFTFEEKAKCILEESYVIALERLVLPSIFDGKKYYSPKDAVRWSMMRICTTLCSGYFREFAVDNYVDIWDYFNNNFVSDFLKKVDNGEIEFNI